MTTCDYYAAKGTGAFACTLNQYCDWFQTEYGAAEIVCEGDLATTHSFVETFEKECFEAKYDGDCDSFDLVQNLQYFVCEDNPSDWCTCSISLNNQKCNSCKLCGEDPEGNIRQEFDCTNLSEDLLFTCEERNHLDFVHQAGLTLTGNPNPVNPITCDYFTHLSLGQFKCTMEEYCQYLNSSDDTEADKVTCSGKVDGEHSVSFIYNKKCQSPNGGGTYYDRWDRYCESQVRTLSANGPEVKQWEWTKTFDADKSIVQVDSLAS